MNNEVATQSAKSVFISLVSFAVVLLIVVSYFVFFTKEKEDTEKVKATITNTESNYVVSGPSNSSNIDNLVSKTAICSISFRFFSPPEKPSLTFLLRKEGSILTTSSF